MEKHLKKSQNIAKKALGLFEAAIAGLQEANEVLMTGKQKAERKHNEISVEVATLKCKQEDINDLINQHNDEYFINLKKIDVLNNLFK